MGAIQLPDDWMGRLLKYRFHEKKLINQHQASSAVVVSRKMAAKCCDFYSQLPVPGECSVVEGNEE